MAAFCGCCGAEITLKAEACPVCGMPRHGMGLAPDSLSPDDLSQPSPERDDSTSEFRGSAPRWLACCLRS
jgi:hypothetical protein